MFHFVNGGKFANALAVSFTQPPRPTMQRNHVGVALPELQWIQSRHRVFVVRSIKAKRGQYQKGAAQTSSLQPSLCFIHWWAWIATILLTCFFELLRAVALKRKNPFAAKTRPQQTTFVVKKNLVFVSVSVSAVDQHRWWRSGYVSRHPTGRRSASRQTR